MSTPTPEPPTPDAARTDRRALYALAALVAVGIVVVVILLVTPNHHNTLVDGPINAPSTTGAAPAPSPTTTAPTTPVVSPSSAAPVTSAPPTSAAPTPTSSPTPITVTAPVTHNPAIPATLSPLEQSAALAYINAMQVENKVWDDNSSDMEVFKDIAEGGELKQLVDMTIQSRNRGYVSRGEVRVTKIDSVTMSADQQTATVTACLDASAITTVIEKTGEIVSHGPAPYVDVVYMHHGADGVWRTPGAPANQGGQSC